MKLYGSLTSPFVRKCRITAIETGLSDRIDFNIINVMAGETHHPNPLNMVPAFKTEAGALIVDSRVICAYLSAKGSGLSEPTGIWADQTLLALADGMTDRAVSITLENRRPTSERSPDWLSRWTKSIKATLAELDNRAPGSFTPGAVALVCALAYLDFRHSDLNWRDGNDRLAAWFDKASQRPSVIETGPPQ